MKKCLLCPEQKIPKNLNLYRNSLPTPFLAVPCRNGCLAQTGTGLLQLQVTH